MMALAGERGKSAAPTIPTPENTTPALRLAGHPYWTRVGSDRYEGSIGSQSIPAASPATFFSA
jgi:hypothetical protein